MINGYQYPRFQVWDGSTLLDTIDLTLTNEKGLTEEYDINFIIHPLYNYSNEIEPQGFHIYWTLHYDDFSSKSNTLNIGKIIQAVLSNNKIVLIPRIDVSARAYEVEWGGDKFELGILRGGVNSPGNRLLVLKFKTKFMQKNSNWVDPDYINFVLDDFALVS